MPIPGIVNKTGQTTPAPGPLKPTESVLQYRAQILGGQPGDQPQSRSVLIQQGRPKVPYPAKTGTGMPNTSPNGIFAALTLKEKPRIAPVRRPSTGYSGGGGSYPTSGGGSGGSGGAFSGGVYGLTTAAGAKLQALQAAYQQRFGSALPIASGGRSYADQVQAYNNYLAGGNLAAKPGTSVHETGNAVDFGGAANGYGPQQTWLAQNGPSFGWYWAGKNFSQVEPWHFEYYG
jgi:hypothetical protein